MSAPKWWAIDHKALLNAALRSRRLYVPRAGLSALAWMIIECTTIDASYRWPTNYYGWLDYAKNWLGLDKKQRKHVAYEDAIRAEAWLRGYNGHRQDMTCEALLELAGLENLKAGEMFAELACQERTINILQRFDPQI